MKDIHVQGSTFLMYGIAMLPIDLLKFTLNILQKNKQYLEYDRAERQMYVSPANVLQILGAQSTDYKEIAGDTRLHSERLLRCLPGPKPEPKKPKVPVVGCIDTDGLTKTEAVLFSRCEHPEQTNLIHYALTYDFVNRFTDFSNGYRTVNLSQLVQLRSKYARLLFVFFCGDKTEFTYNEQKLRRLFQIEDSYGKISALKKCLDRVKKMFEKIKLKFEWKYQKRHPKDHGKQFLFSCRGMELYKAKRKEKKTEAEYYFSDPKIENFLMQTMGMSKRSINSNWETTFKKYKRYHSEDELFKLLVDKWNYINAQKAQKNKNYRNTEPTAYVIGCVKSEALTAESIKRSQGPQIPQAIMDLIAGVDHRADKKDTS